MFDLILVVLELSPWEEAEFPEDEPDTPTEPPASGESSSPAHIPVAGLRSILMSGYGYPGAVPRDVIVVGEALVNWPRTGSSMEVKYVTDDQVAGLARRIARWPQGARVRTLTLAVHLPPPVGKRRVRVWLRQVVGAAWLKWPGVQVHVGTYLPVRDPRAHPEVMLPVVNFNRNLGTAVRLLQQANRDKMVMFVPWHKWMLAARWLAPEDGVWETTDLIWLRGLLQELLDIDGA